MNISIGRAFTVGVPPLRSNEPARPVTPQKNPVPHRTSWLQAPAPVKDGWYAQRATVDGAAERAGVAPSTHVYSQFIDGLRRRLAQAGLPGSAEGVHVVVMNDLNFGRTSDAFSSHTQRIVQIVKGPMGLARAANVDVQLSDAATGLARPGDRSIHDEWPFEKLGELGVRHVMRNYEARIGDLRALRALLPPDPATTTLASSSIVTNRFIVIGMLIQTVLGAPLGSILSKSTSGVLGRPATVNDRDVLERLLMSQLDVAQSTKADELRALWSAFEAEVAVARLRSRVLLFQAAGNQQGRAAKFFNPGSRSPLTLRAA